MCLGKLVYKSFFIVLFCCALFLAEIFANDLTKVKEYKSKILKQIADNENKKKSAFEILESLENDIKQSTKQLRQLQKNNELLEKDISQKTLAFNVTNNKLDNILNSIYQKYLGLYLLDKVQRFSIIPSLDYLQNYNRNTQIINMILEEDVKISQTLNQTLQKREKQLLILKQARDKLAKNIENVEVINQKYQFDKEQYQLFLQQVEKQQKENKDILSEIAKNLTKLNTKTAPIIINGNSRKLPVAGNILHKFGQQDPKIAFYHKNGVLVNTKPNAPVYAISPGKVVFVDKILRYNNIVIIDHGKENFSIYGRLSELYVKKGDSVKAQQRIANVSPYTKEKNLLYFAIRSSGRATDPLAWLDERF